MHNNQGKADIKHLSKMPHRKGTWIDRSCDEVMDDAWYGSSLRLMSPLLTFTS